MKNKLKKITGLAEFLQEQDILSVMRLNVFFLTFIALLGLAGLWLAHDSGWTHYALNTGLLIGSGLLVLFLVHRKQVALATYVLLFGYGIILTYAAWNGAGVQGTTYALFFVLVVAAALFIGRRAGYIAALAVILIGLLLLLAGRAGWLVNLDRPSLDLVTWANLGAGFLIAAHLVSLVIRQVERSLARAKLELDERIRAEEEVRRLNSELEGMVAERTAQVAASQERYRNYIEQSTEGIWLVAFDEPIPTSLPPEEQVRLIQSSGYVAECNDALARMYGLPSNREMIGRRLLDLYGGQPSEINFQSTLQLVRDGYRSAERLTEEINAQGGKIFFLNNAVGVIKDEHLTGIWGTQRDVTERMRAEESLRRQAHEMSLLYEFGISLAAGQDLYSTLRALQEEISQLIRADSFFVAIYDESTDIVSYPIAFDLGTLLDEPPRSLKERPGLTGAVIFSGKTLYLPDSMTPEAEDTYQPIDHTRMVLHTFLGVPLVSKERIIGVLSVQSQEIDAYTPDQIQLVENLAVQAALAIDKASLLDQLQHELSERKQAEEAQHAAEAKYRALVEQIPAITYIDVADGSALSQFVSPQIEAILGVSQEEWMQGDMNFWVGMIHPDDRERVADAYRHTVDTGRPFIEEYRIFARDGRMVWIEDHAILLEDTATSVNYLHGVMFDITERKKTEESLRQANLVVESSLVVLFRWKAEQGWPVLLVTQNIIQFGYTPEELLSGAIPFASIVHPEDLERVTWEVQQYSASGVDRFQQEYRILTKDGRARWVDDRTFIVRDSNGNIIHYQGTIMDITEQKNAEQVRLASHQIAEAALKQNLPEFYQSVHHIISPLIPARNFNITLYNAASDTFSTPFLVDEFDTEWPPYRPGKGLGAYVLRTGQPLLVTPEIFAEMEREEHVEIISRRMVEWLGVPLRTRQGKIVGVMAAQSYSGPPRLDPSHMDLLMFVSVQVAMAIERMQAEAEHEKLIRELTAKNDELERFTYTVSHDLKAPLITIRGFLGYLEEDATSANRERLKGDIERIANATTKMYKLLDELLILSRIGRMKNPPVYVPFEEIVREARGMVEGRLRPRQIEVRIEPDLPVIYGDRPRLVEVLQNLIDNAAKFMGEQAEPRIEVGQQGVDTDGKPILFVRDNGVGIEPQYHDKIFGLFNKLDAQTEGTGVGLALVKRIIEVHECRIWVESEPGKGSTFFFTLPNQAESEAGK